MMILNGTFVLEEEASVSPLNRGMMYGDGCFETFRSYEGKLLGFLQHFDRLIGGLKYLGINASFTSDELKEDIMHLLEQNQLLDKHAMIRLQCWRAGGRGYSPKSREMHWMAQTSNISTQKASLNLALANTRCIPSEALARKYKLSNGLNYIKAAQEATEQQADDALMLTVDEKVSETTSANIFWISGEKVYTPSEECDLLPGVTRNLIIGICKEKNISLDKGEFEMKDLIEAETVFCTNSLIEIRKVESLGKKSFQTGHPLLNQIKAGFEEYKQEHLQA